MVKPDIIVTLARNVDFPVWRWNIQRFRHYFAKVIVCWEGLGQPENYQKFVEEKGLFGWDIDFLDSPIVGSGQDWRDVAVNASLGRSTSEWIWHMEQDFLWKDKSFLETLFEIEDPYEIRALVEKRLHPACILVSRQATERTSKNFGIKPNVSDHFSIFTEQVEKYCKIRKIEELSLHDKIHWWHLAGLTHNYRLCLDGAFNQVYKPDEFLIYNYYARKVPVEQDSRFLTRSMLAEEGIKNMNPMYQFFRP